MAATNRNRFGIFRGSRSTKVLALVLLIATGAAWTAYWLWIRKPVRKFGVVIPGVLYRSGQPEEAGWRFLKDRCGIRTVIDLRENKPNEPWAVLERDFCAQNGIQHIKLPIGHERLTDDELRVIVETISDPRSQPVLVHCKLGRSRTGIVVAAYRVAAQGWSYETALAESQKYKGHMNRGYAAYLRELASGHGWRPEGTPAIGRSAPPRYPLKGAADVQ